MRLIIRTFVSLLICILLCGSVFAADLPAVASIKGIPLSDHIDYIGISAISGNGIAVSSTSRTLYNISLSAGDVSAKVHLPAFPTGLVIDQDTDTAVISTQGGLLVFDFGSSDITEVTVPVNIAGARIIAVWNNLYLMALNNVITFINSSTLETSDTIKITGDIAKAAVYGDTLYIIAGSPAILNKVDLTTGQVTSQIPLAEGTSVLAVDSINGLILTAAGNTVTTYDAVTLQMIRFLDMQAPITAIATDKLTGSFITTNKTDNSISVVSPVELSYIKKTPFLAAPDAIATDSGHNQAVVVYKEGVALVMFTNPVPVIGEIIPAGTVTGSPDLSLSILGSMFVRTSTAHFDLKQLNTSFGNNNLLIATIPSQDLTLPGNIPVTVYNPPPGGGQSNSLIFQIFNPVPKIEAVFPATIELGTAEVKIRVVGKDFMPNAFVTFDGKQLPTKFLSSILLEATVDIAQIIAKTPASYALAVVNPVPTRFTSQAVLISVVEKGTLVSLGSTTALGAQSVKEKSQDKSKGTGTLTGCIVDTDKKPIPNVSIRIKNLTAQTDAHGCFTLANVPAGKRTVLIDGTTATDTSKHHPTIPLSIDIAADTVTPMPFQVYLHKQKDWNFTEISNSEDTVLTDIEVPGVEMRIPKGVKITGWDGKANKRVSVRTVPVDRLPVKPLPANAIVKSVYMFYFDKVGGGIADQPIPFKAPNDLDLLPGDKAVLWYYDESPIEGDAPNDWAVAGTGTVSADGNSIATDPGFGIPKFCCGATAWGQTALTAPNVASSNSGDPSAASPYDVTAGSCPAKKAEITLVADPVDITTGQFVDTRTDLTVPGVIPVNITRYHRSGDTNIGTFGKSSYFEYDWYLRDYSSYMILVKPGNFQYRFNAQSGTFKNTIDPAMSTAVIVRNADTTKTLTMGNGWVYTFANNGTLVEITDLHGNHLDISRQGDFVGDYITQITTPEGKVITFNQTFLVGKVFYTTSVTVSDGRSVAYAYEPDPTGFVRLKTVTYADGSITQYNYDTSNRITSIVNPMGVTEVSNTYDGTSNRVLSQTHADGGSFTFTYTIPNGFITQTSLAEPSGASTTWRWDTVNQSSHYLTSKQTPDGTTTIARDAATNHITSITDPLGRTVSYAYDSKGRVITYTEDGSTHTTAYQYDNVTNTVKQVTDALGHVTSATYSAAGNLLTATDQTGHITTLGYNSAGQPITVTDALGHSTTVTYDSLNNPGMLTDALGNSTVLSYDGRGRVFAVADAKQQTTVYTYDAVDRPITVTDPLGHATQFVYNLAGRLTQVTDAKGQVITYGYDIRNRVSTMTDQAGHAEHYTYDTSDNVTSYTDRKGQVTTFTYNQMNRITQAAYADGATVTYAYDSIGRLTGITDSVSGAISYTYTDSGCGSGCTAIPDKIAQVTTPQGVVAYTYDVLGHRSSRTVTGQPVVNYTYDAAGRLTGIGTTITNQAAAFGITYDSLGRRATMTLPNGVTSNYSFDPARNLLNMQHKNSGNTILESLTYTYDAIGQRLSMNRPNVMLPTPATKTNTSYNALNEVLTLNDKAISYDLNGNMTSVANTCGTTTYTWDARNRLSAITGFNTDCSALTASFQYDALGRRIGKTVNGTATQYLYDGSDIVQEMQGGVATANYIRTLGIDEPLARVKTDGTVRYYQTDALGSVIALTDETGAIRTQYAYDPFGSVVITGDASDNPFQYTGRENDGTGLHYYRARYYSTEMQRFVSEDPIGLSGGINKYSYTMNNPVRFVDPRGLLNYPDAVTVTTTVGDVLVTYKNLPTNPTGAALFLTSILADKSNAIVALTPDTDTKTYIGIGLSTVGAVASVLGTSPTSAFLSGYGLGTAIYYFPVDGLNQTVGDWWVDRIYNLLHSKDKQCH